MLCSIAAERMKKGMKIYAPLDECWKSRTSLHRPLLRCQRLMDIAVDNLRQFQNGTPVNVVNR